MNFDDMDYLFEPTTGTQAPILKRALALAKSHSDAGTKKHLSKIHINRQANYMAAIEKQDWTTNTTIYNDSEAAYNTFKALLDEDSVDFDLTEICNALETIHGEKSKLSLNNKGYVQGSTDVDVLSEALEKIQQQLDLYRDQIVDNVTSENRNIDFPLYFEFKEMMTACFDAAIQETSVSQDKINEYVSTLKLRMQSFVDDIRLAEPLMLDKQEDVSDALIQFLAFVLGDYCSLYNKEVYKDSVFRTYYDAGTEGKEKKGRNQITIIDMSLLPFQVLEAITGLIGRMILEFLSRFEKSKRGSIPVVIALEEAQNYIPEVNRKDRESISKKVFERIARGGRKYGLSLVVSSQRPSELSKTVLSQCNSFIVHRIQNPDDQSYIRKLVSSANSEILNQLPTLPQQHVIIMGDCVRTPIVARMNDAKPRPNSNNPEFISNWLKDDVADYDGVIKKWTEQEADEKDEMGGEVKLLRE